MFMFTRFHARKGFVFKVFILFAHASLKFVQVNEVFIELGLTLVQLFDWLKEKHIAEEGKRIC